MAKEETKRMTTAAVEVARLNLADAEAQEQRARREAALAQIEELRAKGAAILAELEPLAAEVKRAASERIRLHYVIVECRTQIARWSVSLDPLTFPSDEAIQENARQLKRWERKLEHVVTQYVEAAEREGGRQRAVELNNQFVALQYTLRNLKRMAEGRNPGDPPNHGGLSYAETDFLRIPGFQDGSNIFVPAATDGKRVLAE